MGAWYLSLAGSLLLILVGLYIHWSVVLLGLVLPFLPMVVFVLQRRAERRRAGAPDEASGADPERPGRR